eukprot:8366870-Prorocentrum_lima.AAC.1
MQLVSRPLNQVLATRQGTRWAPSSILVQLRLPLQLLAIAIQEYPSQQHGRHLVWQHIQRLK